jgi:hypothetical protein
VVVEVVSVNRWIYSFLLCEHLLKILTDSGYYPIQMRFSVVICIYNPCFPNASLFEGT